MAAGTDLGSPLKNHPAGNDAAGGAAAGDISNGTKTMGDYEDRYPDAFGRGEEIDPGPEHRHFRGVGLSRQVRDDKPAIAEARGDAPMVVNIQQPDTIREPALAPPRSRYVERPRERPRRPLVARTPRQICDDVAEQLNASPFIDATGISITVDDSEVTLDGTINSLIAISLAQALVSNVSGVSRVQVRLRVQPAPRAYRMVPEDSNFIVPRT